MGIRAAIFLVFYSICTFATTYQNKVNRLEVRTYLTRYFLKFKSTFSNTVCNVIYAII